MRKSNVIVFQGMGYALEFCKKLKQDGYVKTGQFLNDWNDGAYLYYNKDTDSEFVIRFGEKAFSNIWGTRLKNHKLNIVIEYNYLKDEEDWYNELYKEEDK